MSSPLQGNPLALNAVSTGHRDRVDDIAVAVIGCGLHSTTSILPSVRHAAMRLVAVCDLDAGRAELARRQFGAERAYRSLDEVLARTDLEAVVVVGPPELHVSAGIAALESGRHVFIEKPPGTSVTDALQLQRASQLARKHVMVGFMKRRASAYRLVKQVIAQKEFGAVTSVQLTYAHWPVAGLRLHLVDMSIHALDLLRLLAADPSPFPVYRRQTGQSRVAEVAVRARGEPRLPRAGQPLGRLRKSGHTLASVLLSAEIDGPPLSGLQMLGKTFALFNAGPQPTACLLPNALVLL